MCLAPLTPLAKDLMEYKFTASEFAEGMFELLLNGTHYHASRMEDSLLKKYGDYVGEIMFNTVFSEGAGKEII